tara:strand:- start:323 stop:715 length:393 start_codon:yes stop_codon:yes gene_type:complete
MNEPSPEWPLLYLLILSLDNSSVMPVSAEAEQDLYRFVDAIGSQEALQEQFNQVGEIDSLRSLLRSVAPSLTGAAVIPLEQATRKPKILVDSGITDDQQIPWRLLRCTGGPLVLQLICKKANFAIWIESV